MKVLKILAVLLFSGIAFAGDASDSEMAERIAAAKARMAAKAAATTQAATSDDPAILRAIIVEQKQQIEALKATIISLNQQIANAKNNAKPLVVVPPKKVPPLVLPVVPPNPPPFESFAQPGSPLGFIDLKMNTVGYVSTAAKVVEVIDGSSVIIEIALVSRWGAAIEFRVNEFQMRQIILKGIPTAALADGVYLGSEQCQYFQITTTQKLHGTTYFVAEPVGKPAKTHR